jgi:cob(I)alamin adenosyltransferase
MGYRLSKIYTRTGDKGSTGMADGRRVDKDDMQVHVIGDVDELNSIMGMLICKTEDTGMAELFFTIQHDLFNLGGQISMPEMNLLTAERTLWLEQKLDKMNKDLPALKEFILPGGTEAAAICHLARSVSRRVERSMVSLAKKMPVSSALQTYINRLSDFLFVAARVLSRQQGGEEMYWNSARIKNSEAEIP